MGSAVTNLSLLKPQDPAAM